VAARVNGAWERIERWLGAHASATLRKLKFGAEPQRLAQWEDAHDRRLPDDLYVSFLRHDGADGDSGTGFQFPGAYGLLGVFDIDSVNWSNCHILVLEGDREAADPETGRWHGSLLPIGSTGEGKDLFVEPRTGRVGEAEFQEQLRYDGPMGWPSYVALLEATATALESGGPLRGWHPTVVAGCELRWSRDPSTPPAGTSCAGGPRPTPTPTSEPTPEPPTAEEIRGTGCRVTRRDPVVRAPSAAATREVRAVWRRIERWLARRAPVTYEQLGPPATPLAIAKAEAAMGARFPDDLRASLLRHDGATGRGSSWGFGPAPFYDLMSAKALHADWKMLCDIVMDDPAAGGDWWHGRLIPFAATNDGGNLFIDPSTGRTGEFYDETGLTLTGDPVWPSYLALLKATASALETGKPLRGWRAGVTKGALDWANAGPP
jgi:cell wall assembly regulator SMI1